MPDTYGLRVGRYGTPCEHIVELEKIRKDVNAKKHAEHAARSKTIDQKMLDVQLQERDERAAELKRANDLKEKELELLAASKDSGKRTGK